MLRSRAVVSALFLVVSANSAVSQARGGLILALPTSPRALGLADAAAATAPDAWTTFLAPALLSRISGPSAAIASEAYLVSTQLSAVAATIPMGRGTLGLGATLLDYGSVAEITSSGGGDGVETGKMVSAQDNAFVIAYGTRLGSSEHITVGVALELATSRIADLSSNAFAGSVGMNWATSRGWDLALGLQHLGPNVELGSTKGILPHTLRISAAAPTRSLGPMRIRPIVELRDVDGSATTLAGAVEGEWSNGAGATLQLRLGGSWRGDHDDDHSPISGGVGLVMGPWAIDYAPEHFRTISQFTHRFGVRYARQQHATPK
jgi:hypothetical protein